MKNDQIWVKENIDEIMKIFIKINPQFNVKDNASHRMAKSRHKKNMLENMDTIVYRPIYFIAKRNNDHLEMKHERNALRREIEDIENSNDTNYKQFQIYKEKSCKLEIENRELKKQIEELKIR